MHRCTVGIYRLSGAAFKLEGMRLPQSILRSLSVCTVSSLIAGIAVLLLAAPQLHARAGAPQLVTSPPSLRFGALNVGQTETMVVTVTNTGETSATISQISQSNGEFTTSSVSLPLTLAAGQSLDLSVSFTPSTNGWTVATVNISSNASNPTLLLNLEGTGISSEAVSASPTSLSFGQVAVGSKSTLPIVLSNSRSWPVTLAATQTVGSPFSMSGVAFPFVLNAGQSLTLNVTFTPQSAGEIGGSLFVIGPGLNIPLVGTGGGSATGQLTIAPAPLNFGNVPVGTTQTAPMSITASGANVTVYSTASSSSQFVLDGASFPFTINAGQSQTFNVAFTPQTSGSQSAALAFTSNASNPQSNEALSGTGTATQYNVNLYWNASSDVAGYNVYRSAAANGSYAKINASLDANTAYTDSTVAAGQTYYYAATSVSSSGTESARSTPAVQVNVP